MRESECKQKMHLVAWHNVCRSKEGGGLGVKNTRLFNIALLEKWLWRIRTKNIGLWFKVLLEKYENECGRLEFEANGSSRWWKDISSLEKAGSQMPLDWFSGLMIYRLGDGEDTLLWHDKWVLGACLREHYHRMFSVSMNQKAWVSDMGE